MRLLLFALVFLLGAAAAYAAITCTFNATTSCGTATRLIGVGNDTGGYNNAHAENYTNNNYANSVCCTLDGSALTNSCGTTLLKLSEETNAHVEQSNGTAYSINACLNATTGTLTCAYTDSSCAVNYTCVLSMANADLGENSTNAHIGDCGQYTRKLCCTGNSRPSVPVLITPTDNNNTVFSRFTFFNWSSTDADGDAITYYWNITSSPGCAAIPEKSMATNQYTSIDKLCTDNEYRWTVKACDSYGCSAYATPFNFTIPSVVGITFTTNTVDFGSLAASLPGQDVTDNTLDNAPGPLHYNNTGNVDMLTTTKANAALWTLQPLNTSYLQYADQDSSSWVNWDSGYTSLASNVSYPYGGRQLEVRVVVPQSEPSGAKSVLITAMGASIE